MQIACPQQQSTEYVFIKCKSWQKSNQTKSEFVRMRSRCLNKCRKKINFLLSNKTNLHIRIYICMCSLRALFSMCIFTFKHSLFCFCFFFLAVHNYSTLFAYAYRFQNMPVICDFWWYCLCFQLGMLKFAFLLVFECLQCLKTK